jgi:hypothetical protein
MRIMPRQYGETISKRKKQSCVYSRMLLPLVGAYESCEPGLEWGLPE